MRNVIFLGLLFLFIEASGQSTQKMDFETYNPVNTLVVPKHPLTKSKFPFIDVHNHQSGMGSQNLTDLIKDMDKLNMKVMINLSGRYGNDLKKMTDNVREHYPNRFIVLPISILQVLAKMAGQVKPLNNWKKM